MAKSRTQQPASAARSITSEEVAVIILAAGQGKRMRSQLPKVLHEIAGESLVFHILDRVSEAAPQARIAVIVGHGREQVQAAVSATQRFSSLNLTFVHQAEQKGTGHAARCAMDSEWGDAVVRAKLPVLVMPGDAPLLTTELLQQMLQPLSKTDAMRVLTTDLHDATGYGRIVRRGKEGPVLKIVEHKDATLREKAIREINTSIYLFHPAFLQMGLRKLSDKNAQAEYYLTDLIAQAARSKRRIDALKWPHAADVGGINDLGELAQAARIMNNRTIANWMKQGVRFLDPSHSYVDTRVKLAEGILIYPNAMLTGSTVVASGVTIGAGVQLKDVHVGANANIKTGTVAESSKIGEGAQIGPYAHLRPESDVGPGAKIGNFVELKKTKVGSKTSIAHLSYLGDAEVGSNVNIGCGFVTCNYDGVAKHKTVIEDGVFLGSDCQVVAPVRIGKGAYIASGSTITEDVEPGSLAIARSRQVSKPDYARKLRDKMAGRK